MELIGEYIFGAILVVVFFVWLLSYLWQVFMYYLPRFILVCVVLFVLLILGGISLLFGDNKKEQASNEVESESFSSEGEQVDWSSYTVGSDESLAQLIDMYLWNYEMNNIEALAEVVDSSLSFYAEQQRYMQSLRERGVELQLVEYWISSMEQVDSSTYEVVTEERFIVKHPGETEKEVFQTILYEVIMKDSRPYVSDLTVLESE